MSREDGNGNSSPQIAAEPLDLATATGESIIRGGNLLTVIDAVTANGGDLTAIRKAVQAGDFAALASAIDVALTSLSTKPQKVISEPVFTDLAVPPIIGSDDQINSMDDVQTKPHFGRLKVALVWAIFAVAILFSYHYFIAVPAQKNAEERARISALESKIEANFDNYLKAAPLLKGEVAEVFARELDSKIHALGYSPTDWKYKGLTPGQKWKAVIARNEADRVEKKTRWAQQEAAEKKLVSETLEKCRASSSDECSDMAELWLCVRGVDCTEGAIDLLQEYVEGVMDTTDYEYIPPDNHYCVDSTAQCYD